MPKWARSQSSTPLSQINTVTRSCNYPKKKAKYLYIISTNQRQPIPDQCAHWITMKYTGPIAAAPPLKKGKKQNNIWTKRTNQ